MAWINQMPYDYYEGCGKKVTCETGDTQCLCLRGGLSPQVEPSSSSVFWLLVGIPVLVFPHNHRNCCLTADFLPVNRIYSNFLSLLPTLNDLISESPRSHINHVNSILAVAVSFPKWNSLHQDLWPFEIILRFISEWTNHSPPVSDPAAWYCWLKDKPIRPLLPSAYNSRYVTTHSLYGNVIISNSPLR